MATGTDAVPAARWDLPLELIERGVASTLRLRLYRSGAPVLADSTPTVALYDQTGTAITVAGSVSLVGSEYHVTVAGAETEAYTLGEGYRVAWAATVDGEALTYDQPAALCRRVLYPTVSDLDIRRRWSYLDPTTRGTMTTQTTWQDQIDDAWWTIQHRLLENGRRPWMIANVSTFREPHLLLAGSRIHAILAARGNVQMQSMSEQLSQDYERAWGRIQLQYDVDEDGNADDLDATIGADGGYWLGGAPASTTWRT